MNVHVTVHKAQPHHRDNDDVADLSIRAVTPLPDFASPADQQATLVADAENIVHALLRSLPGGTVDAVLRLLLEDRASRLRVRWPA